MMGNDPALNQPVSESGSNFGGPLSSNTSLKKKVAAYGSHMSVEELRLNKGILREIAKKKKTDIISDNPLSQK